jgi:ABC-type methionine transport system permease subunit
MTLFPYTTLFRSVMSFALALLLGASIHLSAAYLVLNIGLIPFSPAAVYKAQLLIIPGITAFARKITAENREKVKP